MPAGQSVTARLKAPDGTQVATAKFDFSNGYATITIATTGVGVLAPGFHGVHIHKVGRCEPNSVAPTGGAPGDFLSAGGHFQVAGAFRRARKWLPDLPAGAQGRRRDAGDHH